MRLALSLAAAFLLTAFPAAADNAAITDLEVLPLQYGVNEVPHLAPDGRDGKIIMARRQDGNGLGYQLFLVMLEGKVVGLATDNGFEDTIKDEPHTVADAVKSVRFARGKVGGEKQMLVIIATRNIAPDYGPADPAPVTFDIYQLVPNGAIGTTGDYFTRIKESFSIKQKYCNADLALNRNLGLPLPVPYQGPNLVDGCF